MMRKILWAACCVCLMTTMLWAEGSVSVKLLGLTDEQFPVLAWGGIVLQPLDRQPEYYREMQSCGFTVASLAGDDAQLAAARAAGMKVLLGNPVFSNRDWRNPSPEDWARDFAPFAAKYKDDPAVAGFYVKDEPQTGELDGLAPMAQLILEQSGKLPYINLFPMSAEEEHFAPLTYAEHVAKFMRENPSPVASFDQYVFLENGQVRDTFYTNFKIFRDAALQYNKEWWYIGLSIAHRNYAVPTYAQMNLAAFAALAYGARGISWFKYSDIGRPGWWAAPLTPFGEKTPTWFALQRVNRSIQNYAYVLNHLKSDRVYHFITPATNNPERSDGPDDESLIASVTWPGKDPFFGGGNWVIGEFTHDQSGDRYLIVVNKSLEHTAEFIPVWREGKKPKEVRVLQEARHSEAPFGRHADNDILEPGGSVVLHLIY